MLVTLQWIKNYLIKIKVLNIPILVFENSETCNNKNFTFWITKVLSCYIPRRNYYIMAQTSDETQGPTGTERNHTMLPDLGTLRSTTDFDSLIRTLPGLQQ